MIEISGLDHIVFRTTRLDEMLHFYCDVLGCTVERELPATTGLTQLRAGHALIDLVTVDSELGRLGGSAPVQDGRNVDHVCLQVSTFDETALPDYLHQHGIRTSDIASRYGAEGFGPSLYIEDPEGNVIELKEKKNTG